MWTLLPTFKRSHLRFLRTKINLSLSKLADYSGVARTSLQRWEEGQGSPSHSQALALARSLGVSATDLFEWEDGDELAEGSIEQVRERIAGLFRLLDRRAGPIELVPEFSGARLREARKLRRLTQQKLAEALGLKRGILLRWEQSAGLPHPDQVEELGRLLEREPGWFYVEGPAQARRPQRAAGPEHGHLRRLLYETWQQSVTVEDLAHRSGLDPEWVHEIFRKGRVSPSELRAMRKALGLQDSLDLIHPQALNQKAVQRDLVRLARAIESMNFEVT